MCMSMVRANSFSSKQSSHRISKVASQRGL